MTAGMPLGHCDWLSAMPARASRPAWPLISQISSQRKAPNMTDIGSRTRRRRPGYAWLAVGPVAAAGAIAIFIAAQPAGASTTPTGPVTVGNLSGLGSAGGLSGLGAVGNIAGLSGIAGDGTGAGPGTRHGHRHGNGDDCGCMTPTPTPTWTTPTPTPTSTTPTPMPTTPTPTPTKPKPPAPGPAPMPTPVGNN